MTPYYVVHRPNPKHNRVNASYIYYYICARHQKQGREGAGHSNRVGAKVSESWVTDQLKNLVQVEGLIEQAIEMARAKCSSDLEPQQRALELNRHALKENQTKIDHLLESVTSGEVAVPFLAMLNSKAAELQREQEQLRIEGRGLQAALTPLHSGASAQVLRDALRQFDTLCEAAEPDEMQRLVRTLVHRIEWQPDGEAHSIELYALGKTKNQSLFKDKDWFETMECPTWPGRTRTSDQSVNSRPLYH